MCASCRDLHELPLLFLFRLYDFRPALPSLTSRLLLGLEAVFRRPSRRQGLHIRPIS